MKTNSAEQIMYFKNYNYSKAVTARAQNVLQYNESCDLPLPSMPDCSILLCL